MRRLFAQLLLPLLQLLPISLLTTACLQAHAAGLSACDRAVRFSAAWFADPDVDNGKKASELTKTGASAGGSGGGTQLGHVVVQTQLTVVPQTTCTGVVVRLEYLKPMLRIAKEMAPGSCAYAWVMTHEQMHVRIHRDIARQFRELSYPWSQGASAAAILSFAKQELDRLMQAQDRFDSPEEYAKNQTVCGGEIPRLVKASTPPKASRP